MSCRVIVVTVNNMKARSVFNRRNPIAEGRFVQVTAWELPEPVLGCEHPYKYRLAYVVDGVCVVRFDNEHGKGDHWHCGTLEQPFVFAGLDRLLMDFEHAIARWNDEHGID